MSAGPAHVRVEIRSDPKYLSGVREMVGAVARRLGFDQLASSQVALAVDEALANVICHGYERRLDGSIWVSIWPEEGEPGGIRIVIEDEARQVDCGEIKGRDLEDVRPGGLGVHIIKHAMDDVVYEKRDCCGMRLTMVKRLGGAGAADQGGPDGG
ncbi:MAG: ATP-binding protein [Phycisphaeraceae bacterium]|nr:ATP-binding protein [Phycisphaeraceae bacterium]